MRYKTFPKICHRNSVMDPNTLNLDTDPGFWPNIDPDADPGPDPDQGLCYQFQKKKLNLILENNNFLLVKSLNCEFISLILHLLPLCYLIVTSVDPDPQSL